MSLRGDGQRRLGSARRGHKKPRLTRYGPPVVLAIGLLVPGVSATNVSAAPAAVTGAPVAMPPMRIENEIGGKSTSTNWSGYAVTGTQFTDVTSEWTAPKVKCPNNKPKYSAAWVGLDGFLKTSSTVEQVGTEADCDKVAGMTAGVPTYYAWWQMYPQMSVSMTLPIKTHPVVPGDVMYGEVQGTGDSFTLTLNDITQGWDFSMPETSTSTPAHSSAEWIVEDPSKCDTCNPLKLADFGTVDFSMATANAAAISTPGYTVNKITMTSKGTTEAKPSALSSSGSGSAFDVSWVNS